MEEEFNKYKKFLDGKCDLIKIGINGVYSRLNKTPDNAAFFGDKFSNLLVRHQMNKKYPDIPKVLYSDFNYYVKALNYGKSKTEELEAHFMPLLKNFYLLP